MTQPRLQRTLAQKAIVEGRGYWTGLTTHVEFRPAEANTGITFVRDDLVHSGAKTHEEATIQVHVSQRQPATRRTVLANQYGVEVAMIEHVVATLAGLGIDNCEVGVTAPEMPGSDGSAIEFVDAVELAGKVEQGAVANLLVIREPVRCGDDRSWIEARPPIGPGLTIEYRLDYGTDSAIGRQWLVVDLTEHAFRYEVAPARTFVLESEANSLISQGLAGHVTPQELLIFKDQPATAADREPIENSLRFADECVRHKILDVVGDLALAGQPIVGHFVAFCSGHRLNGDLVEKLLATHPESNQHRRSA